MSQPSKSIRQRHSAVLDQLDELVALAAEPGAPEQRVPAISGWSVGEHLEHMARVDREVLKALAGIEAGGSEQKTGRPTLMGYVLLTLGFIPRGKAKAVKRIQPQGWPEDELRETLAELRGEISGLGEKLAAWEALPFTRPHPVLGDFRPAQWLRFLWVHHRHHQKIIRDIRARA